MGGMENPEKAYILPGEQYLRFGVRGGFWIWLTSELDFENFSRFSGFQGRFFYFPDKRGGGREQFFC